MINNIRSDCILRARVENRIERRRKKSFTIIYIKIELKEGEKNHSLYTIIYQLQRS
jgi:hypothetical protein